MSTVFSFYRFNNLLRVHWIKTWKSLAVISVIAAGLIAIGLVYLEVYFGYRPLKYQEVQGTVFSLGFIVLSIGFCLNFYLLNWQGSKKSVFLSMPVSAFERTLLGFVWIILVFIIWYLILFYTVSSPILKWANSFEFSAHPLSPYRNEEYTPSKVMRLDDVFRLDTLFRFLIIQTMLLASLLWFKRYTLVKSFAIVFLMVMLYGWLQNFMMSHWLTPPAWVYNTNVLRTLLDPVFTEFNEIKAPSFWSAWHKEHLYYVWIALWGIIYYRTKEQEA